MKITVRRELKLTEEVVQWAYRVILGRTPSGGEVRDALSRFRALDQLIHHLIRVDGEFAKGAWGRAISGEDYEAGRAVTTDFIRWCYRVFLLREPELESVVAEKMLCPDEVALAREFFQSGEFVQLAADWAEDFAPRPEGSLPLPPIRLRRAVGATDLADWENYANEPLFADQVPPECYGEVFDFGCGSGRVARRLLQQEPRPTRYLGIDLNVHAIEWCQQHLTPIDAGFQFRHIDVQNPLLNPDGQALEPTLPQEPPFTLVIAHSVFTHIIEKSLRHYLRECARLLARDGALRATWFLFDKTAFPMMQEEQNSLYINTDDPTNAVIYDYRFIEAVHREVGLTITRIVPPTVQGFQWALIARRSGPGIEPAAFPRDIAEKGVIRPPNSP